MRAKIGVEAFLALAVAFGFLTWSGTVAVDPMVRVGQVSGMAQLQFRFAAAAIVLVVGLVLVERFLPAGRPWLEPVGCACAAGLFTGLVAGGIDVALEGTPYGLWAGQGDYAWIGTWATSIMSGHGLPAHHYPPLSIYALAWWAQLTDQPVPYAMKGLQLIGTALFGPATYLAWRLLLRPAFALGVGVVAMIPFVEPVKAYPQLTLVVLIPVLVRFLRTVRRGADLRLRTAVLLGVAFGAGIGLLFLLYSGWFVWCAPGFVAAFVLFAPLRRAWRQVLALALSAAVTFLIVTWVHLTGLLSPTGGVSDAFFYFDTDTEPAYFAMWRNDRPGNIGPWPPPGELGYVGVFTLLLGVGIGVALWLGWRRTTVATVGLVAVGAWLIRMWLAGESYSTMTVRLYPRTTMVVLYCALILAGYAVLLAGRALRRRISSPLPRPPWGILLIPLLFLFALTGSATIDHFMPGPRGSAGDFATDAHITRTIDGGCPRFGLTRGCLPTR
jgi:galactan 5-O-arabinofuranosyltransferase